MNEQVDCKDNEQPNVEGEPSYIEFEKGAEKRIFPKSVGSQNENKSGLTEDELLSIGWVKPTGMWFALFVAGGVFVIIMTVIIAVFCRK